MLIYQTDNNQIFTGTTKDIDPKEACPRHWTRVPLELTIPEGKFAQFDGVKWFVRDSYPNFDKLVAAQEKMVSDATASYKEPVEFNSILWRGGEASALAIKGATDLANHGGITSIVVRDANNDPHAMTISEAMDVAAAIGFEYQRKFQAKEEGLRSLKAIDLSAPDCIAQIDAIKFEDILNNM